MKIASLSVHFTMKRNPSLKNRETVMKLHQYYSFVCNYIWDIDITRKYNQKNKNSPLARQVFVSSMTGNVSYKHLFRFSVGRTSHAGCGFEVMDVINCNMVFLSVCLRVFRHLTSVVNLTKLRTLTVLIAGQCYVQYFVIKNGGLPLHLNRA